MKTHRFIALLLPLLTLTSCGSQTPVIPGGDTSGGGGSYIEVNDVNEVLTHLTSGIKENSLQEIIDEAKTNVESINYRANNLFSYVYSYDDGYAQSPTVTTNRGVVTSLLYDNSVMAITVDMELASSYAFFGYYDSTLGNLIAEYKFIDFVENNIVFRDVYRKEGDTVNSVEEGAIEYTLSSYENSFTLLFASSILDASDSRLYTAGILDDGRVFARYLMSSSTDEDVTTKIYNDLYFKDNHLVQVDSISSKTILVSGYNYTLELKGTSYTFETRSNGSFDKDNIPSVTE